METKLTLHLDSSLRTNTAANPNTSNFILQREILSMTKCRLKNINLPFHHVYNIIAGVNDTIGFDFSDVPGPYIYVVPPGYYTMEQLAALLEQEINAQAALSASNVVSVIEIEEIYFTFGESGGFSTLTIINATSTIRQVIGINGNIVVPPLSVIYANLPFEAHYCRNIYILTNFKYTDNRDYIFNNNINTNLLNTGYIFGIVPISFNLPNPQSIVTNYLSNGDMIYQTYEDDYRQIGELNIELYTLVGTNNYILLPFAGVDSNYSIEFEITTKKGF
jgi:hypothetical protein